ncbi:hypothetical protein KFK14_11330 [Sphingobium phenoxybenzoativorans]|uniref:Uncharacterized protein n=1 Tax=Sphingobium phenoxybenzoativorans TaxID=1592790 RepID=A0A975KAP2_9SPHN|nr:hypothetical protein [Sphingobium phenoxybenzoativorans]QUT07921.1 hypothetical protein KFK14_11330 [Sphingobium phenoxybenzoativorans]
MSEENPALHRLDDLIAEAGALAEMLGEDPGGVPSQHVDVVLGELSACQSHASEAESERIATAISNLKSASSR